MQLTYRLPLGFFLPKAAKGDAVLLVRDDGIGDLVYNSAFTVDLLSKAGYDVYAVVKGGFLEAAKLFLSPDHIIPFDNLLYRASLKYRYEFLSLLRKRGYAIALGSVIASSVNCDILRYCGASKRWGYETPLRSFFNYRGIKRVKSIPIIESARYLSTLAHETALLRSAFPEIETTQLLPPRIAKSIEPPRDLALPERYIVYLSDVGDMRRSYPRDILLPVLAEIAPLPVIVLASKEYEYNGSSFINLTGKTSLKEAIAIVLNARMVIGNESGLSHIAHLADIPTALFLGGGHWGRFLPLSLSNPLIITRKLDCFCCGWKCKYDDYHFRCINSDISEVREKLSQFFSAF
ncbi:MAG: hypothetical protein LBP51_05105 [Deferribacteraceae bacterium]|jgi:ADP-heptose:LPS heptosyltransferase|nr:hypothetical protein [Deferribacteraceae bacterium]